MPRRNSELRVVLTDEEGKRQVEHLQKLLLEIHGETLQPDYRFKDAVNRAAKGEYQ